MKITIDRELLERVLNAILNAVPQTTSQAKEQLESLLALRGALAQPQQEPVAWMHEWEDGERIPLLYPRDNHPSDLDPPKSVRPLVYGDTPPPAQQAPVAEVQQSPVAIILEHKVKVGKTSKFQTKRYIAPLNSGKLEMSPELNVGDYLFKAPTKNYKK